MRTLVIEEPRTGALRALNYAPVLERIRQSGSGSSQQLRKMVKRFGEAYGTVFTRLDCDPNHGVRLLSQTDTFAAEPRGRIIRRDSMPDSRRHEVRRWQILISGAGQMSEGNLFGRSIIGFLFGWHLGHLRRPQQQ
jgi:type I restriction enzyme S subunit